MGAGPAAGFWPPDKLILNVCFLNGGDYEQSTVKSLVRTHYNSIPMRLRFKFRDTSPPDIRILFTDNSKSYIGRQAEAYPDQPTMWLNMHPRLHTQDAVRDKVQFDVLHEFGHALGLIHEHKHPHCKAKWNYSQLMDNNGWGLDTVRHNYNDDTHSAVNARWDRPYDRKSIMHYAIARGDTQSGLMNIPQNIVLSESDKETLGLIYPSVEVVKHHPTVSKESSKKYEKEKREKKSKESAKKDKYEKEKKSKESSKKDKREKEMRLTKSEPRQEWDVSLNNHMGVYGCYQGPNGACSAVIHGPGHVFVSGNGNMFVYGNSTVWASGNTRVYVNGSGSARVSGNATVEFTGTGRGDVTENASIRWYL
ncbi:hypothetical protein N7517_004001 [Penicillium concentricum]|uniref:Peptidase M12A domain-containing protein n=1 Tax=Penicillium concentricum TaxID=293559 RepID=A0A9W9VA46_9EURO|nr:uncharacterized protein N7517_004001 [Penicillium concentricum]KAJ5371995.1 hypothetical protein N7517_004001 [Penicillium concentricum]